MHAYMSAVGFSEYKKKSDINELLRKLAAEYGGESMTEYTDETGEIHEEIRCEVARNMGIIICVVKHENGELDVEYYYPYMYGETESSCLPMSVHRHVDEFMFSGLEDDPRLGITLIFRMINAFGYMNELKESGISSSPENGNEYKTVTHLAALCNDGKIILPVNKTEEQVLIAKEMSKTRDHLIDAAKKGDENAIEQLTMGDMNMFASLNKRLGSEDIYSIVDTCFMPQGVECDVYSVIGDIIEVQETKNYLTGEELFDMTVECNDMVFHVGINKNNLIGQPEEGRRFKGRIWMLGYVSPADSNELINE